ncbi:MAG: rhamnulose-1-phosphate aldolase [Oribacterium sp.]|nr:rhamnulose-1-phosphate aldolase [Oribacterium sp.]MBP3803716.1 rhamnulose-1-phosphate aldolase [Oribacterium sp.]
MKVTDSKILKGFTRMCQDGFDQGWHERNGGNLSYRMKDEEVKDLEGEFRFDGDWKELGTEVPDLKNEYFMVSGSGKYMRNMQTTPEENICIIRLDETGTKYQIVWGLIDGGKPTSELPTHLMNLEVCKKRDENIRVVYHCHPANVIALTYVLPLNDRVFTREIFEMATECPVVFPKGIGVIPWLLCGGKLIGEATAKVMEIKDVAVWAHHGAFACGTDFDITFGLMHTVEKAAEVLVKVMSMTDKKLNTITPAQFRELNEPFGIEIDEQFLYEKKTGFIGEMPQD